MDITWFDSNSWLLGLGGQQILVDPWLQGELVFGSQAWLFKGEHPQPRPLPERVDLILLSQGLPDHAHPPTLKALDRSIPVVGSPSAAKVAQQLGYTEVIALSHGETFTFRERVTIKAVVGAPIGPTTVENGYVLRDRQTGNSLFYEPHGFHAPELKAEAPVDVLITPVLDLALPLVGPIIRGQRGALELVEWLRPQVLLPTADAAEVRYSGPLVALLKVLGSPEAFQTTLKAQGYSTRVVSPQVGQLLSLDLQAGSPPTR
ncbi:MAG TPA: MBL fold metallo-hydrolase [Leptolyngbyaceae cyanobacterium M65_K2018_010]|nr:MBL fold metallo-hydrolase [Leptolyngbyaceae cyanobacterium M65_K2018_010]